LEKEPNNVEFLLHRSQCFYDMGQFEDAIHDLEHALKQNEGDSLVLYK